VSVYVKTRISLTEWNGDAKTSREAAQEYSPRRKPWVKKWKMIEPEGAEEQFSHTLVSAGSTKEG
jgi:hypothetical protein